MQKNLGYFGHLARAVKTDLAALGGASRSLRRVAWFGYIVSCVIGIVVTPLAAPFTAMLVIPLLLRLFFWRRLF